MEAGSIMLDVFLVLPLIELAKEEERIGTLGPKIKSLFKAGDASIFADVTGKGVMGDDGRHRISRRRLRLPSL